MQMPALQVVFLVLLLRSSSPGSEARSSSLTPDELALQFVKSTLPDPAGSLVSWNTSNHLCSWRGVSCGRRHPDRVVALQMNSLGLGGRISPFLGNLSFLRTIDLGNNSIGGRIPASARPPGPASGAQPQRELSLSGDIPAALGSCKELVSLSLDSNHLHGEIPAEVGALRNLVYLSIQFNDLAGEVPPSVANLSSIQVLRLGFNTLSGAIPPSLGGLPKLSILYLTSNNLSGSIPNTLWNVSSLTSLSVLGNNLTGTVPEDVFDNVPRLQSLYMTDNRLHGRIPGSISNASNLVSFQAGHNYFSGAVPSELGGLKGLQWLSLNYNLLEAKEPKDWNFMNSLTNCSQLQNLQLDSNALVGELPSSASNLSTSLKELGFSDNQIFGAVPENIGNLIGLETLALESNNLSGHLPSSLSILQNLQYLSLSDNNLWGGIRLIENLTQLKYLYIGYNSLNGTIPTTLGKLASLLEFDFSMNNFTGVIPGSLRNIPSLAHHLDLSHNLLEGPIPLEIGNLKSVSIFHAESNRLSGEIPGTIGECYVLQNLHLQNNFLRGTIPQPLSELKNLQMLDLSNNNFSGQIPKFLGNMGTLIYLNLSFNNLTGEVPTFGVFSNASAFSIHGNVKLCGGIFDLHLPPCPIELSKKKAAKKISITSIVFPTVATVIVLLFLYFFLTWNKRRSTRESHSTAPMQSHPPLTYSQLAKATDGFSAANMLGAGTFSTVYKGKLDGDSNDTASFVAVKVLKLQAPGAVKSFIAECEAMRNIRHRNLVKIITACSSIDLKGDDFKAIVFEFMPNGSLEGWLHPSANDRSLERQLSLLQRVNILFDVAYALDYLHFNGAAPIVHCDLKPSNVLLDVDMVAHVGDFGLAKILAEGSSSFQPSTSSVGFRGTIGYAPPEYGAGNAVSTHGDIYSYGILVLEMITGRRPTDNTFEGTSGIRKLVETSINNSVMDIIDMELMTELENERATVGGSSSKRRMDSLISLLRLGLLGSVEMPSSRISTKEVIKELHVIKNALAYSEGFGR